MGNSSLNFFIRFRSIAAFLLIFFACALDTLALQAGELIFPASSHIGLVPPNNMVVSPDFAGFVDRETSTSILITAMPKDAFDEVAAGMTAERLATQGMKLLGPCNNVEPAFESHCYRVTQEASGYLFQKWLLLALMGTETAMVVATIPDVILAEELYSESEIEQALSSLAYRQSLSIEPISALPFVIEESSHHFNRR